jgi:hypothetical protein
MIAFRLKTRHAAGALRHGAKRRAAHKRTRPEIIWTVAPYRKPPGLDPWVDLGQFAGTYGGHTEDLEPRPDARSRLMRKVLDALPFARRDG